MKAYRDDVRKLAEQAGRNPDEIKVLSLIAPVVAETREQAASFMKGRWLRRNIQSGRWHCSVPSPTSTSRNSISTRRFRRSPPMPSRARWTSSARPSRFAAQPQDLASTAQGQRQHRCDRTGGTPDDVAI